MKNIFFSPAVALAGVKVELPDPEQPGGDDELLGPAPRDGEVEPLDPAPPRGEVELLTSAPPGGADEVMGPVPPDARVGLLGALDDRSGMDNVLKIRYKIRIKLTLDAILQH